MVNGSPILLQGGWLVSVVVASAVLARCDSETWQIGGQTGPSPVIQTAGSQMYTDTTYGFTVGYPNDCVILEEAALPIPTQPPAV